HARTADLGGAWHRARRVFAISEAVAVLVAGRVAVLGLVAEVAGHVAGAVALALVVGGAERAAGHRPHPVDILARLPAAAVVVAGAGLEPEPHADVQAHALRVDARNDPVAGGAAIAVRKAVVGLRDAEAAGAVIVHRARASVGGLRHHGAAAAGHPAAAG